MPGRTAPVRYTARPRGRKRLPACSVRHRGYAAVRGPRAAAIKPASNVRKRSNVNRRDPGDPVLSRLPKSRGKIEIGDRKIVAQKISVVQAVFQYAKCGRELLQLGRH